jgi:hypothetical protein
MSTLAYIVDYNNIKSPRASADSRRASASTIESKDNGEKFTLKGALQQLKPTEEQIIPSGIYTPIIKRGSLFSFRRGSKPSSRKHSQTQANVDAALLR